MKIWLINLADKLRGSFWFVPTMMSAAALLLSILVPQLDRSISLSDSERFGWLTTSIDGARATLSALAAATVTAVTVVFSITMVTLSLTTQQFGPRLLRRFTQNHVTQVSLGALLATSLYCLLLLRWLDDTGEAPFVPHLSVAIAVLLAVCSFISLIWFIHDMSVSVQAQNVIKSVADDLNDAIKRLFPQDLGEEPGTAGSAELHDPVDKLGDGFQVVPAREEGYIEAVDEDGLLSLACRKDLVLELLARPGDFILLEQPLARLWPADGQTLTTSSGAEHALVEEINECYITGTRRTPRQDVECAINELVEVAVRALSPAINDPFTAIASIDRLGGALTRLAIRKIPSRLRHDAQGRLRVIAPTVTFPDALSAAFNMIRQYGRGSPAVIIRLMQSLAVIGSAARRGTDRAAVRHHAEMLRRCARESWSEPSDCDDLERRYDRVIDVLEFVTNHTQANGAGPRPALLDTRHPTPLTEYLPHHESVSHHQRS